MDTVLKINRLRDHMKEVGVDVALIPTSDCHNSEYAAPHFKLREYLSGFTGSAGTLIVGMDFASLYTDGRYFIQAAKELDGSGIVLMKSGTEGVPKLRDYLKKVCPAGKTLYFDTSLFTAEKGLEMAEDHPGAGTADLDIGFIWPERPALKFNPVFILEEKYSGMSVSDKLTGIREKMSDRGAEAHVLSTLDDIAWILNLRGNDIKYCPLFYSYLIILKNGAYLYANIDDEAIREYLQRSGVTLRAYEDFYKDLDNSTIISTEQKVLLDKKEVSYRIYASLDKLGIRMIFGNNPSRLMKAVKNPVEADNVRKAHIFDAVAMIKFEKWLHECIRDNVPITEMSAAEKLSGLRSESTSYVSDSFETICAYNDNAAIVHYSADKDSDTKIDAPGILLVDSGGHYLEGTTDITRTYVLSRGGDAPEWLDKFKHDYTLVAAGMLKLMNFKFKKGTRGSTLDAIARQPLWNEGLDFDHGTGHGVGYLLNVHEGPNRISFRSSGISDDAVFEAGMVTSDEPGVYVEGQYGIRIENLILCLEDESNGFGSFLSFEPLTMVPIDLNAIDKSVMSDEDIKALDSYHERVYETISPYLDKETRDYLKKATERIAE